MKLARYGRVGKEKPALVDRAGKLRDLSGVIEDIDADTLAPRSLLLASPAQARVPACGARRAGIGPCVKRLAISSPSASIMPTTPPNSGMPVPKEPVLFNKAPSCLVGPNDDVMIPERLDEDRLGGRARHRHRLARALCERGPGALPCRGLLHLQRCLGARIPARALRPVDEGQGLADLRSAGPWLVTPDEIEDVQALDMWLDVNGERMQTGSTETMVFGVKTLVSYISQFMTLEPGDVITTGTPPGVGSGKKPPRFLKAGETISLGIEGLGRQDQRVIPFKAG